MERPLHHEALCSYRAQAQSYLDSADNTTAVNVLDGKERRLGQPRPAPWGKHHRKAVVYPVPFVLRKRHQTQWLAPADIMKVPAIMFLSS